MVTPLFLLSNIMESFLEYFEKRNGVMLEYRHEDALGVIKLDFVNPKNRKGGRDIVCMPNRKNLITKGPYKKERKNGEILIGNDLLKELGSMGGIEFEDGKEIKRKNSNQMLKMFTNAYGQQCGKIVEIK